MPARHRSRQHALQVLYLWDVRKQPIDEAIASFYETLSSEEDNPQRAEHDAFMETLVHGASQQAEDIDRRISEKSEHWRLERMPAVDRNLLRLAIYEMTGIGTPAPVVSRRSAGACAPVLGRGVGLLHQRRSGRCSSQLAPGRYLLKLRELFRLPASSRSRLSPQSSQHRRRGSCDEQLRR